ncbi:hypothetical protein AAG906_020740 [Vitis piasezkii]
MELAAIFGCKVGALPTTYLGLPLTVAITRWWLGTGCQGGLLEKIYRDFLWGGGMLGNKPQLVKWDIVCLDKRKGGLRVRCLNSLNMALICKWIWGSYGVGLWKVIWLLWELVSSRTLFVVGNGRRVKLWKDSWCGDEPLWGGWNPSFFRPLNDWDSRMLLVKDSRQVVVEEREDEVVWAVTKSGSFSVKSSILSLRK